VARKSQKVQAGDTVEVCSAPRQGDRRPEPEDIPLNILYEVRPSVRGPNLLEASLPLRMTQSANFLPVFSSPRTG
jgi:hypothetical protein